MSAAPVARKRITVAKSAPEAVNSVGGAINSVGGADAPLDELTKSKVTKGKATTTDNHHKAKDADIASIMCALGGRFVVYLHVC